jgi:hypothetical protein
MWMYIVEPAMPNSITNKSNVLRKTLLFIYSHIKPLRRKGKKKMICGLKIREKYLSLYVLYKCIKLLNKIKLKNYGTTAT